MRIELPILVEQRKPEPDKPPAFFARALFLPTGPARSGQRIDRVLTKLAGDLRDYLNGLAGELDHRPLVDAMMNPPLESRTLPLTLDLRRQTARGRWLAAVFTIGEKRLGFVTEYPDLWFVLTPGQSIESRVTEVLCAEGRRREKEELPLPAGLEGRAYTTQLAVTITAQQQAKRRRFDFASIFGGPQVASGAEELRKVARALDAQYPDGLDQAYLRHGELRELTDLLDRDDRPSVLLVGPAGVGKTTLMHEYVRRWLAATSKGATSSHNTWLVSPQRLISGMSFVGQWEQRLLAILKHARKRDHILVVDDVVGLFHAGVTSQSDQSVAQTLKPYIERREVRIVGEMTPQALRVLREVDRGFADLFHVIHVREPDLAASRRMLIAHMRRLEDHQRCRFDLEALPTAFDLARRYLREAAFPGKAAALLAQLATRHKGKAIGRAEVIEAFHERSGLPRSYVDDQSKLSKKAVVEGISRRVIAQSHAIEAMADVVCVGKARLSDPARPLGSLLFLGPTGVGKTQYAKSLAAFLYGREDRLLRFDMNSFNDHAAAARLVGTFRNPDGQLTAAVRRQPFSVVLLDEIEKAHPDVLDLLLQLLGEGRLTDALGRTADFSNAIIVLTSNLGVREASQRIGFRAAAGDPGASGTAPANAHDDIFTAAARHFFRPELFNRFDRIVPFHGLGREDIGRIADILMADILQREGLHRRSSVLRVDPAATAFIIDTGFDEHFGARAMRRALEQQLTRPISSRLAALPGDASVLIDVLRASDRLEVATTELRPSPRRPWPGERLRLMEPAELAARVEATLERIEDSIAGRAPTTFTGGAIHPVDLAYLALREEISDTRRKAQALTRHGPRGMPNRILAKPPSAAKRPPGAPPRDVPKPRVLWRQAPAELWAQLLLADEPDFYLKGILQSAGEQEDNAIPGELVDLLAQLAWLEASAAGMAELSNVGPDQQDEQGATEGGRCPPYTSNACLLLRSLSPAASDTVPALGKLLAAAFDLPWGMTVTWHEGSGRWAAMAAGVLALSGLGAAALAAAEAGTHMVIDAAGGLTPIQAIALPCATADAARSAVAQTESAWQASLSAGHATINDRPFRVAPIHRIVDAKRTTIDLRTGLMTPTAPRPYDLMAFALSQLPLPAEITEAEY